MAKKKIRTIKRNPSLANQVSESLRHAVLEGHFNIGDRITEEETAQYLGVSRTPVREALSALANDGILQERGRGGYDLNIPSAEQMENTYEIRAHLEPFAMELVVHLTDAKHQRKLKSIIDAGVKANREDNRRNVAIQNLEFRQTLYENCQNDFLREILTKFNNYSFYLVLWTLKSNEARNDVIANQKEILRALEHRDVDQARAAVQHYIKLGRKHVTHIEDM